MSRFTSARTSAAQITHPEMPETGKKVIRSLDGYSIPKNTPFSPIHRETGFGSTAGIQRNQSMQILKTTIIGEVAGSGVERTLFHTTAAKSLSRLGVVPRYDGKAFHFGVPFERLSDLEIYLGAVQGRINLIELDLIPVDRPEALFPSRAEPGEPIVRIPHATWWQAPNGSLLGWSDCYSTEVRRTVGHFRDVGWSVEKLPLGYAHWNRPACIPLIASADPAVAVWLKACILEGLVAQAA